MKFLCEVISDKEARTLDGDTACAIALRFERFEVASYLITTFADQVDINTKGQSSLTPLARAAFDGRISTFNFIKEHGGDIRAKNLNDESVFLIACKRKQFEVMNILLQIDPSFVDDVDSCGHTGLMFAAMMSNLQLVQFLLHYNANIHLVDARQYNALMFAAQCQHGAVIVSTLCQAGIDINAVERNNNTALVSLRKN